MFGLFGIVTLAVFAIARPLDFFEPLRGLPFLYIFFALAVFGMLLDAKLGYIKLRATPQLPWAVACFGLALLAVAVMAPAALDTAIKAEAIVLALYLVVGQGVQYFKSLEVIAAAILTSSLWIAIVCTHQGLQPRVCVAVPQEADHTAMGEADGRPCDDIPICYVDPPEPQAIYRCERAGLLGITSIDNGRVRYVGVLHDPNEVALTVSVALPLAVAFHRRRRNTYRKLLLFATALLAAITVIMSESRGGVLVYAAVVGVYAIYRYGWRGILGGAVAAIPVLLLGGRSGAAAEASTDARLEIWYEGLQTVRAYPLLGVGQGQFVAHHELTAHNSLLLVAAEAGLFGALAWAAVIYLSLKIPWRVLREVHEPEGEVARTWALALLASLAGITVGAMLLSFSYHFVLWVYVGMSAALWAAVKQHKPDFSVGFGWRDALLVAGGTVGALAILFVLSK